MAGEQSHGGRGGRRSGRSNRQFSGGLICYFYNCDFRYFLHPIFVFVFILFLFLFLFLFFVHLSVVFILFSFLLVNLVLSSQISDALRLQFNVT
jgi:hypothetical protein